jgi:hypothetical protein
MVKAPLPARAVVAITLLSIAVTWLVLWRVAEYIYPPNNCEPPPGSPLPNLVPSLRKPKITYRTFAEDSCAIVEKCIVASGTRKLLRFDLLITNAGRGNLYMGEPEWHLDEFVYSPCHGHYHFEDFSNYVLLDANGTEMAYGHKQAFCLRDNTKTLRVQGGARPGFFSCNNQGISSGWSDIYYGDLDCQWIDITDVPSGNYVVKVRVNPVFNETNYDDNEAFMPVVI